jgi:hypothetical protein
MLANLAYGVTTTRDPQTGSTDVLSYTDRVEAGTILGPRIYSTGPGVFAGERIRSLEQARNVLKRYSESYDTKTIKMYGAGNRQVRQWIMIAARELRLMPTTEAGLAYRTDITMAIDGYSGIEHNLPISPLFKDVIELFRTSGTVTTPTLSLRRPGENFYTRERARRREAARSRPPTTDGRRGGVARGGGSPGPGGWPRRVHGRSSRLQPRPRRGRRQGGHRQSRTAPGTRLPLGALVGAVGRDGAARRAARGDDHGRRGARARPRPGEHRAGEARRPRGARGNSDIRNSTPCATMQADVRGARE